MDKLEKTPGINRRNLITGAGAAALHTPLSSNSAQSSSEGQNAYGFWDTLRHKNNADTIERRVSTRHNIPITGEIESSAYPVLITRGGRHLTIFGKLTAITTHKTRLLFIRELESALLKFPTDFLQKTGVKSIKLAREFQPETRDRQILGILKANFAEGQLAYFTLQETVPSSAFQQQLYHEIGHALTLNKITLEQWAKSVYGSIAQLIQAEKSGKGFVFQNGTAGFDEDMADVFAFMLLNPDKVIDTNHPDVRSQPFLKEKIEFLTKYIQVSFPELSMIFWKDLAERRIDEKYWLEGGLGHSRKIRPKPGAQK